MGDEKIETKRVKLSFNPDGGDDSIRSMEDLLLLGLDGEQLRIEGKLGETGVVLTDSFNGLPRVVVASLPHPRTRPKWVEGGKVVFGAIPGRGAIEFSLQRPVGQEVASEIARGLLMLLRSASNFENFFDKSGMGGVGCEFESWVIDPETGVLAPISGGELQEGLLEVILRPIDDPLEYLRARSQQILRRAEECSGGIVAETSVPLTSHPWLNKLNLGSNLGPYILAIQQFIFENYFSFATHQALEIMDQLVKAGGFDSTQEMHWKLGHMAYWGMAASHASVGLCHLDPNEDGRFFVPLELAIAIADIFNSDLATVAEFLMFSTPMVHGQRPALEVDGKKLLPNDYRAILRYLIDTSNPGPFIGEVDEMYKRIKYAITNGLTHTIDRASYLAEVNGGLVPVAHGRVRNRISSAGSGSRIGRIEFTGCSASPSIIDETARNCFLQILMVAALEAVAASQMPQEYYGQRFPHLASWQEQKRLAIETSSNGFHYPPAVELIEEAIEFTQYVSGLYPALKLQAEIVIRRLRNLLSEPAGSLRDYLENPQGSIAEVIKREVELGEVDPLGLALEIHTYQLELAVKLLEDPLYWLYGH